MYDYRQAVCVHLHDQRLMITDDIFTHATDSQWNEGASPEYTLSPALAKLVERLIGEVITVDADDFVDAGISRGYAEFPCDGPKLQRLEVRIVSDRIIDLRLKLAGRDRKDDWIEEWTYAGSFTVKWAEAT